MANEGHLRILRESVDVWNQWRKKQEGARPDLSYANLSGVDLRGGASWQSGVNLIGANLSGTDLRRAILHGADFRYANLTDADLRGADFTDVRGLSQAQIRRALGKASTTKLSHPLEAPHNWILAGGYEAWNDWREEHPDVWPDLSHAYLPVALLPRANLKGVNAANATFQQACLDYANLSGADLSNANLCATTFENADLSTAKLNAADLSIANLRHADLIGADLTGANLAQANLTGADLTGVDLTGADLTDEYERCTLSQAQIQKALGKASTTKLSHPLKAPHSWILADGTEAWNDWREENPDVRPDLRSANLISVNLIGADLTGADLTGADLTGANFTGASVHLDLVYLGKARHAAQYASFSKVSWHRVFVGPQDEFDPDHYDAENPFWLTRQGDESFLWRLHQLAAEDLGFCDDIIVEFSRSVWRELHLVEYWLGEALGHDAVTFEKSDDRLAVTFKNREDVQVGIENVMIQMVALEAAVKKIVHQAMIRTPEGEKIIMQREYLDKIFHKIQHIGSGVASIQEQLTDGSTPAEDAVVDSVGSLPVFGPLVKPFAKKAIDSPKVRALARLDMGKLFKRFLSGFRWIKEEDEDYRPGGGDHASGVENRRGR